MQYDPELVDPLAEVRDVVESFRSFGVTPAHWQHTLSDAATALDQLPAEIKLKELSADLLPHIRTLLSVGLPNAPEILAQVADQVAGVLSQAKIQGIPRP